jgi:hypothetical protein
MFGFGKLSKIESSFRSFQIEKYPSGGMHIVVVAVDNAKRSWTDQA